jgi:hypothetical protein
MILSPAKLKPFSSLHFNLVGEIGIQQHARKRFSLEALSINFAIHQRLDSGRF